MSETRDFSIPPIASLSLDDETGTRALAAKLADLLAPGDVVALEGTLGVGKSVLARNIIQTLTTLDEDVPSPTFTLVQTYEADKAPLFHFDLYRLCRAEEALELDIEDAFYDGISLIEWPAKLGPYLPEKALWLHLKPVEGQSSARTVDFYGNVQWQDRLKAGGIDD